MKWVLTTDACYIMTLRNIIRVKAASDEGPHTAPWIGNTQKRQTEAEKMHVGEREGSTWTQG